MPERIKQRELVGLWAALLMLAAVAVLAYRSVDTAADTLERVEHADTVLREITDVSSAYARSVTARRAYLVAGDASQLEATDDLDTIATRAIRALRLEVADNAVEEARADELSDVTFARLADLDAAVGRRRAGGPATETTEGLALAARVRTVREAMEAEENRLLQDRSARTKNDLARTKLAEIFGTLASIGLLLFVFRRLGQEIGRRRLSEQALRANEAFLDSIVENIPNMVFVKEAGELRFERINRAGEDLLGIPREELLRKNDFDFFPEDQAEAFQARDRETLENRVVVDVAEEPIQTKSGERWLHTKKVPVADEHGAPKYLLGISEDITERRLAAAALQAAKDAAEAANQELEAFSYSVAHDLRAPLRAIDGFSQALQEDCEAQLDDDGKDHVRRVRAAALQMAQLIDGLLGLSRLTRSELVRERVDLTRIAEQSAARLRDAEPDRAVELVVQPGLVAVGDPRLLAAVFDNLLGNAWKFTSRTASPRVQVGSGADEESGRAFFFVKDNGAGFDQAYAHKLFGAFQRLHAAAEFVGSGIGLATVQRIVRRHGGRIWAEGKPDHGATFRFTL